MITRMLHLGNPNVLVSNLLIRHVVQKQKWTYKWIVCHSSHHCIEHAWLHIDMSEHQTRLKPTGGRSPRSHAHKRGVEHQILLYFSCSCMDYFLMFMYGKIPIETIWIHWMANEKKTESYPRYLTWSTDTHSWATADSNNKQNNGFEIIQLQGTRHNRGAAADRKVTPQSISDEMP